VTERLILVDARDRAIGTAEKLLAHRRGLLHRAVSVFIFGSDGRLLLQRRAREKYHSGSLWSNTCCSHPRPGERAASAAARRLREEMGMSAALSRGLKFTYFAKLDHGLLEHEVDHVFTGVSDVDPRPDPREVEDWRWISLVDLQRDLAVSRGESRGRAGYTAWLPLALDALLHQTGRRAARGHAPS